MITILITLISGDLIRLYRTLRIKICYINDTINKIYNIMASGVIKDYVH